MEFKEFPKMARLSREVIITEKIDGTNASIFIQNENLEEDINDPYILAMENGSTLRAGSRTKWLRIGEDNFGFAEWALSNYQKLLKLGEGHHFGEWWGQGIQRSYELKEKRFSLFNTIRWSEELRPSCCHVVPVLYQGKFDTGTIDISLAKLVRDGSQAAPGFMKPEGIVIYHTAGNVGFKKTIEKDEIPKSLVK